MQRRHFWLVAVIGFVVVACGDTADVSSVEPSTTVAASTTEAAAPETSTTAPAAAATSTSVPARSGPGYGGSVVIGDDQHPPTLNPYAEGGDNFIVAIVGQALHTGVWDVDASTLRRIPEVVVDLPTVANGGIVVGDDGTMTVSYRIRDEAVWADGTPITGDDFAFTYATLIDPDVAAVAFRFGDNPYELIVPGSVEAGAKTFRFTLERASLDHEQLFHRLIPRHQVDGTDVLNDWNTAPWLSGGPFLLDTWEPNRRMSLVRNDNYWKTDPTTGDSLPYLDEVVFEFIPETESLINAFANRELDVINPPPYPPELERFLGGDTDGAEVTIAHGPVWEHLNFQFGERNRNEDSFNRYLDFRRAVAHAIDRQGLADEVQFGYGDAMSSYLDVYLPEVSAGAWDRYDYDPDRARELVTALCTELERDCVNDPPTLVFSTTSNGDIRIRIADWLERALEEVGIEVLLELEDSALYFGPTLDAGTFDAGLWAWVGGTGYQPAVAAHDLFDPEAPPPEGSNYYRWGTPAVAGAPLAEACCGLEAADPNQGPSTVIDEHTARFAELRDLMNATVDERELDALILEAEEILADQVVIIPLFSRLVASAVWADEIGGYQLNTTLAGHTWNIEEWYRTDR